MTLTDDELRILRNLGAVMICRIAAHPAGECQLLASTHLTSSIDWPGVERGAGPWVHATSNALTITRTGDRDILTGKITRPIATLTYRQITRWADTIPAELREEASRVAYPYADHDACHDLADRILEPDHAKELTLW